MEPEIVLAEGRQHVRRVLEQLEAIRWQLIGITLTLPEPFAGEVQQDISEELDAVSELRTTLECVVEDGIGKAIKDLKGALASTPS